MPKQKQTFSRRCPYCKTRFKTHDPRKQYDHPRCRKYAYDKRQKEKIIWAENLRKQVSSHA